MKTRPLLTGNIVGKWRGVEAQIRGDNQILDRCRNSGSCPPAAREFLAIINKGRETNGHARIGVINRAVNLAIEPATDLEQWGVPDRWSAPLETFTSHRGDCEDYAIAKYVALRAVGFDDDDVKLVVVRDTAAGESHMVAAVRVNDHWIILDNRWLALVQDRQIWRGTPLAVLDDTGVREFVPRTEPGTAELQRPTPRSSL